MGIQVVLDHMKFARRGIHGHQRLTKLRVFFLRALGQDEGKALARQGFNRCQQSTGPVFLISVMFFLHVPVMKRRDDFAD